MVSLNSSLIHLCSQLSHRKQLGESGSACPWWTHLAVPDHFLVFHKFWPIFQEDLLHDLTGSAGGLPLFIETYV